MNFETIQKRVGKKLQIYTDTGGWLTNRAVTQTDIGEFINDIYKDEIFPIFAEQRPERFTREANIDSWLATGTVSASSTGSTLVMGSSIFTTGMAGLYVYNDTDDEYMKIESYTSATTVELEEDIDDTWDGDTVYVIGKEFGLSATNGIWKVIDVAVKYSDDVNTQVYAGPREERDIYQYDRMDMGFEGAPSFYVTNVLVSGVDTYGIGIDPQLRKKVTNAITLSYIPYPADLSGTTSPIIENIGAAIIEGAVARGFGYMQDPQREAKYEASYEMKKAKALSAFNMGSANDVRLNSGASSIFNRWR